MAVDTACSEQYATRGGRKRFVGEEGCFSHFSRHPHLQGSNVRQPERVCKGLGSRVRGCPHMYLKTPRRTDHFEGVAREGEGAELGCAEYHWTGAHVPCTQ